MTDEEPTFCRALATWLHRDQIDKQGKPYILHVSRVVARLPVNSLPEIISAAWLHDVAEDTSLTVPWLAKLGVSKQVCTTVARLTRSDRVPYSTYIDFILLDPNASIIKLADLADNTDPRRGKPDCMTYEEHASLLARYANAKGKILTRYPGFSNALQAVGRWILIPC